MEVRRKMLRVVKRFVLGVAVRKRQLRCPKAPVNERPDNKHAFFFHQKRCPATHLWALLLAKSLLSMLSLFDQLQCGYGFQSQSTHRKFNFPANPPRLIVQCFLSGRSATADIAWTSLLDLPLQSKRNPDGHFRQLDRCRESREMLRFEGCAKMGFIAKMFECISSGWLPPSIKFPPYLVFPFCAATKLPPPPHSSDAPISLIYWRFCDSYGSLDFVYERHASKAYKTAN